MPEVNMIGLWTAKLMQTQNNREIWITRGHLAALGTATLAIALLAFFVGIQVGRSQVDAPTSATTETLLPNAEREDALEALLREVEAAQAAAPPLAFPETLAEGGAADVPEPEEVATVETAVEPAVEPEPTPPPEPSEAAPPPQSGWSVQIASYDTVADADARVAQLKERKMKAYRVAALIRGKNWYRVKVGSYPNKDSAAKARTELARILGTRDLMITEAP